MFQFWLHAWISLNLVLYHLLHHVSIYKFVLLFSTFWLILAWNHKSIVWSLLHMDLILKYYDDILIWESCMRLIWAYHITVKKNEKLIFSDLSLDLHFFFNSLLLVLQLPTIFLNVPFLMIEIALHICKFIIVSHAHVFFSFLGSLNELSPLTQ